MCIFPRNNFHERCGQDVASPSYPQSLMCLRCPFRKWLLGKLNIQEVQLPIEKLSPWKLPLGKIRWENTQHHIDRLLLGFTSFSIQSLCHLVKNDSICCCCGNHCSQCRLLYIEISRTSERFASLQFISSISDFSQYC